jgi:drug/metabolite transporter (DMT)-like permease
VSSTLAAWGRMTFGFVILLVIALFTGKSALLTSTSMSSLFPILGSITLLSLYVLSLYKALSLAPATLVTCILILSTIITNVLSNLVLNQPLAQPQILISLASIAGVSLTVFFARSRKDLRHEQTS